MVILFFIASVLPVRFLIFLLLVAIIISLIDGGWLALAKFGPGFIFSSAWDPVGGQFGAAAAVYGTFGFFFYRHSHRSAD